MPLIDQQDVVHSTGQTYEDAIRNLKEELDTYPSVKIVSLSAERSHVGAIWLIAVVESI